jgi:hypothetical protein
LAIRTNKSSDVIRRVVNSTNLLQCSIFYLNKKIS